MFVATDSSQVLAAPRLQRTGIERFGVSSWSMKRKSPQRGMSAAVSVESRIDHVDVTDETITAHLTDGRVISVPLAWSWRLSDAAPEQRANWQLIGNGHGVHWPDVDEDISADGMLHGVPAKRPETVGISKPVPRRHSARARTSGSGTRRRTRRG